MLAVDGAGRDAVVEVHGLAHLAPGALDPGPIALLQTEFGGCLRVDLHAGHRPQLAAPRQLAMLAVEVHGDATAGDAEDRVLLVGFRVAHPGVDTLHVVGSASVWKPGVTSGPSELGEVGSMVVAHSSCFMVGVGKPGMLMSSFVGC